MWSITLSLSLVLILSLTQIQAKTYTNPILPGWHSDPSCTLANETIFCTTSTFLAYPGLPIYASEDLLHWKLASNAFNRESQIPVLQDIPSSTTTGGNFAPTLRYRNGTFYLIVTFFVQIEEDVELKVLVFRSTDPWSDDAWSQPMEFPVIGIDPDIFWDDHDDNTPSENDDLVYVTSTENHQIQHYTLNLTTGQTSPPTPLWNGTGSPNPEGPHLYKKGAYYYLILAEGGTELGHSATVARSKSRTGPWEASPHNPLLTNRNTTQFFQTVGHADLFQDAWGRWWAVALGTRSGPGWRVYPMGRETVLAAVEWGVDGWPVARGVRGVMEGGFPPASTNRKDGGGGGGGYVNDPDEIDFEPGSAIPRHFVHWRFPKKDAFAVSSADSGHANALRLTPSVSNLTGNASSSGEDGITFIARRQTDTLFTYSVDLQFDPKRVHEEAGVTVFLTQAQHIDLGIVSLPSSSSSGRAFRFHVQGRGNLKGPLPVSKTIPVPESWKDTIRLQIQAVNATHYAFSASSASSSGKSQDQGVVLGYAEAAILSGGTGPYTGALVGAYATTNGVSAESETETRAYISRWRYHGQGQEVDYGVFVPRIPTP